MLLVNGIDILEGEGGGGVLPIFNFVIFWGRKILASIQLGS